MAAGCGGVDLVSVTIKLCVGRENSTATENSTILGSSQSMISVVLASQRVQESLPITLSVLFIGLFFSEDTGMVLRSIFSHSVPFSIAVLALVPHKFLYACQLHWQMLQAHFVIAKPGL